MHLNNKVEIPDTNMANIAKMTLDDIVSSTCFCKLREHCQDKASDECMRNSNIYQAFMLSKK